MCLFFLFFLSAWTTSGMALAESLVVIRAGPVLSSPALSKVCVIPTDYEGRNTWKERETEVFWNAT